MTTVVVIVTSARFPRVHSVQIMPWKEDVSRKVAGSNPGACSNHFPQNLCKSELVQSSCCGTSTLCKVELNFVLIVSCVYEAIHREFD